MKTTKIIIISLVSLLFFGVHYYSSNKFDKNQLASRDLPGIWKANEYPVQIRFTSDSVFYSIRIHKDTVLMNGVPYSCHRKSDTIFIKTENNSLNFILLAQGHKVIFCDFKPLKGFKNHIDEVFQIHKKGNKAGGPSLISENKFQPDVFILPEGFLGMCEVAFNQKEGSDVVYNKNGSRVFRFADSLPLFLQTRARESVYNVAVNNIKFYYADKKGHLKQIQVVSKSYLRTGVKLDTDKVYVVNLGFNQRGRVAFDKWLHKKIHGNIAFFEVLKPQNRMVGNFTGSHSKRMGY